jgi:hypothetical protein
MYQEIIATKGGGNLKKVVTNIYGFTTDEKLLMELIVLYPRKELNSLTSFTKGHN